MAIINYFAESFLLFTVGFYLLVEEYARKRRIKAQRAYIKRVCPDTWGQILNAEEAILEACKDSGK